MSASPEPMRVTVREAAVMLAVAPATVRRYVHDGTLSASLPPKKRGRGKRIYLVRAEVEAFAVGGSDAARKVRVKTGGK